eukprot:2653489-Lingulodinium_polyedra.AAC.1
MDAAQRGKCARCRGPLGGRGTDGRASLPSSTTPGSSWRRAAPMLALAKCLPGDQFGTEELTAKSLTAPTPPMSGGK